MGFSPCSTAKPARRVPQVSILRPGLILRTRISNCVLPHFSPDRCSAIVPTDKGILMPMHSPQVAFPSRFPVRHQIEIVMAIATLAGLGFATSVLVSGPLADHFHSLFEALYGGAVMMLIFISIVTGTVIGAWDATQEAPRPQHRFHLRHLLHH